MGVDELTDEEKDQLLYDWYDIYGYIKPKHSKRFTNISDMEKSDIKSH